jgi:hypothetical protein
VHLLYAEPIRISHFIRSGDLTNSHLVCISCQFVVTIPQLAITFHGGIHMITTEWGSYNHYIPETRPNGPSYSTLSPDDLAQNAIAASMSAFAGRMTSEIKAAGDGASPEGYYAHGRSSDLLYAVYGGMEDWGYAANWDATGRTTCNPTTFGGYAAAKTTYTTAMFRAFNILVETSGQKKPSATLFGKDANVLKPESADDGHVPRNVRMALQLMDLVQPYVQLVAPTVAATPQQCSAGKAFPPANADPNSLPGFSAKAGETVAMSWEVGGAMTVDETFLMWAPVTADLANLDDTKPGFGLSSAGLLQAFGKFDTTTGLTATEGRSTSLTGFTRWSGGSTFGTQVAINEDAFLAGGDIRHATAVSDRQANPYIPAFSACATMPTTPGTYYVMARAKVDQKWGNKPTQSDPNIDPQSHIVNARTKNDWPMSNNGRKIRAQVNWYSVPVKVVVSADGAATGAPTTSTPGGGTPGGNNDPVCRCKGTLGPYETCVPYGGRTACLVAGNGGKNTPPTCTPPLGAASPPQYSNNYAGWYVYGCKVVGAQTAALPDGALPLDAGSDDRVDYVLFGGIAVGAVSLVVVGGIMMNQRAAAKNKPAGGTRYSGNISGQAVAYGHQAPQMQHGGMQSGNPMYGGHR